VFSKTHKRSKINTSSSMYLLTKKTVLNALLHSKIITRTIDMLTMYRDIFFSHKKLIHSVTVSRSQTIDRAQSLSMKQFSTHVPVTTFPLKRVMLSHRWAAPVGRQRWLTRNPFYRYLYIDYRVFWGIFIFGFWEKMKNVYFDQTLLVRCRNRFWGVRHFTPTQIWVC